MFNFSFCLEINCYCSCGVNFYRRLRQIGSNSCVDKNLQTICRQNDTTIRQTYETTNVLVNIRDEFGVWKNVKQSSEKVLTKILSSAKCSLDARTDGVPEVRGQKLVEFVRLKFDRMCDKKGSTMDRHSPATIVMFDRIFSAFFRRMTQPIFDAEKV